MKRILIAILRFYRRYISPAFPGKCRFIPTCSEYGIEAIEKKDYEAANTNLQKAERIITEFRVTLNMDYEISHQLMPLYNYAYDCLVEGNMKSSVDKVNEAKDIISGLRDAWAQAMKKARADKGPGVREGRA